jgi:biotin carboxyl carrier protein
MIYHYGGAAYDIRLEPLPNDPGAYRVTIGERVLIVQAEAFDGGWRLMLDGQQIRVYTASRGHERYVSAGGETYTLTVPQPGRRRSAGAGGSDLTAPMPGQVREVFVQAGDLVQSGQTLLLLEAMKMEIRVRAPAEGRVSRLLVRLGDVVDRGQTLVEMEKQ